jgi:hypothetical protein
MAFDPVTQVLIENYMIVNEIATPSSPQRYFKINPNTGIISLIDLPLVNHVQLNVIATSLNGISSNIIINIDLTAFNANYYPNLMFDPNVTNFFLSFENIFFSFFLNKSSQTL